MPFISSSILFQVSSQTKTFDTFPEVESVLGRGCSPHSLVASVMQNGAVVSKGICIIKHPEYSKIHEWHYSNQGSKVAFSARSKRPHSSPKKKWKSARGREAEWLAPPQVSHWATPVLTPLCRIHPTQVSRHKARPHLPSQESGPQGETGAPLGVSGSGPGSTKGLERR